MRLASMYSIIGTSGLQYPFPFVSILTFHKISCLISNFDKQMEYNYGGEGGGFDFNNIEKRNKQKQIQWMITILFTKSTFLDVRGITNFSLQSRILVD